MNGKILKELSELVQAQIVSEETAEKIRDYYQKKGRHSPNLLFTVFAILGSLLTGLGIILIIAHNWDELSRPVKVLFSFLPLAIGHGASVYALLKRKNEPGWKEGSSAFLFLSVGASISLVAQVYNIHGDLGAFLLTWSLLGLPIVYVMSSSMASLLYISGITYYACELSYWGYPSQPSYLYWILFLLALPHYYLLFKNKPTGNFTVVHHWLLPISLTIVLGTLSDNKEELMFISYSSLFGIFYLIGTLGLFEGQKLRFNSYRILGSLGTIILLLMMSFTWFWEELHEQIRWEAGLFNSQEGWAALALTLTGLGLLVYKYRVTTFRLWDAIEFSFPLFVLLFFTGMNTQDVSRIAINLLLLFVGIATVVKGEKENHLGVLNYGLCIITALVTCRFFDSDMTFIVRGLLFMGIGAGFFVANYRMAQKRKQHENQ